MNYKRNSLFMPNASIDIYYKPYTELYGGILYNVDTDIGGGEVTLEYTGYSGDDTAISVNDLFVAGKFGGRIAASGTKTLTLAFSLSTFADSINSYLGTFHSEDITIFSQPSTGYYKCLEGVDAIAFSGTNTNYVSGAKIISLSETIKQNRAGYAERYVFNSYSNSIRIILPKDIERGQLQSLLNSKDILLISNNSIYNSYSSIDNYNYYSNSNYGALDPLVRPAILNEKSTKISRRFNTTEIECFI